MTKMKMLTIVCVSATVTFSEQEDVVSFRFGGWVRVLNNHKFKRTFEEGRFVIITHVSINKRFLEANGKKVP